MIGMIEAHKSTFFSLQQRDKVSQNSSQLLSTLRANDCVTKFVPPHSPPNSNNSSRMTKDIDIHLLQNKLNGRLEGKGGVQRAPDLNIVNNQIHQETTLRILALHQKVVNMNIQWHCTPMH